MVSGDGRYYNDVAIVTIIRMLAAAGVTRIIIGENGLISTPCVSGLIRSYHAYGGILLTASHNPGGIDNDFGIKYNGSNGGPAPESLTDKIYNISTKISSYQITHESPDIDLSKIGSTKFGDCTIDIINAPKFYAELMKSIFDFDSIRQLISRRDFKFIYDSMSGVAGPFAVEIFINQLGADKSTLINSTPSPDFNNGHPDPNLTYAHDLVKLMGLNEHGQIVNTQSSSNEIPDFGAAADGDADRNMILGKQFFVTPSDSLALIAANAHHIPYFSKTGITGIARSMPTSMAADRVADKLGLKCYEVPTGWKYFGNLMDADLINICGEESFGTGSNHIREKDGMWAVLAWLSILVAHNKNNTGKLITVQNIVEQHWKTYGRNFYSRYDYENVTSESAADVMSTLTKLIDTIKPGHTKFGSYTISTADNFTYHDPVDQSVSKNQGIRYIFSDGSRLVWRLSGTGSSGATIRLYIEKYEPADSSNLLGDTQTALKELVEIAADVSQLQKLTGRDKPTVIT